MDALENANKGLSGRLSEISKRLKPKYPLEDDERERLIQLLREVPQNGRFHFNIFWPQLNGNPRNAYAIADVFSAAQWDVSVKIADSISGHGLVFAFGASAASDKSKRSPEAVKMIELFGRAKVDWAIDTLASVPEEGFLFIVANQISRFTSIGARVGRGSLHAGRHPTMLPDYTTMLSNPGLATNSSSRLPSAWTRTPPTPR